MQQKLTPIAEYIERMRMRRDPPPSWHYMSVEAGVSASQVNQIVKGRIKVPTSDTIRKLVRRWGTPEDERELLRLAGHPAPLRDEALTESDQMMLDIFHSLPEEQQRVLTGILEGRVPSGDIAPVGEVDESDEWTEMHEMFGRLSVTVQQNLVMIARALYEQERREANETEDEDGDNGISN